MSNGLNSDALIVATCGAVIGALSQAFNDVSKEFRKYAGADFNKSFEKIESTTVRSIENAPYDGIPEEQQILIVEQARKIVTAAFRDARSS
jgi:hypothetical protein